MRRGFARDDLFVCVHEQFLTETARWADVVLPATMFLEHDDLYQAGGHSHFQIGPQLIPPPGECRSNHEVLQGLASRLGASHRGFDMTAMQVIDATLRASGWPDAATVLRERWIDAQPDFADSHFLNGFGHGGQIPFRAGLGGDRAEPSRHAGAARPHGQYRPGAAGGAVPPGHRAGATVPQHQLLRTRLGAPARGAAERADPPGDAARLGVAEGDRVRLGNALGEVVVHARLFDGLQPGVLVVEGIWPGADFEGGIGINALVSDDPAPPLGGAVFHDTAIWAEAAETALAVAAD